MYVICFVSCCFWYFSTFLLRFNQIDSSSLKVYFVAYWSSVSRIQFSCSGQAEFWLLYVICCVSCYCWWQFAWLQRVRPHLSEFHHVAMHSHSCRSAPVELAPGDLLWFLRFRSHGAPLLQKLPLLFQGGFGSGWSW